MKISELEGFRQVFGEAYDETLVRQVVSESARWQALDLLGEGTYFEARALGGDLAVKVLTGDQLDHRYWRQWEDKLRQLSGLSGTLLGWPIYKVLNIDETLALVTLRLSPGKRGLAEKWGDIAHIERTLFTKLEEEGVRIGDHIQWGTRDGVPFLMDLSDLIFLR